MADHATLDDAAVIERLRGRVHRLWLPRRVPPLDLLTALRELGAWVDDDHWWRNGSFAGWLALIADVSSSAARSGPAVQAACDADRAALSDELDRFALAIKQDRRDDARPGRTRGTPRRQSFTSQRRGTITDLIERLQHTLATGEALRAGWLDLLSAAQSRAPDHDLDQRQAELWLLAIHAGHPADRLAALLGSVLADGAAAIAEARAAAVTGTVITAERAPDLHPAGWSPADRLAVIGDYLATPVAPCASEVWLAVEHAHLDDAQLSVGPVTFWSSALLRRDLPEVDEVGASASLPAMVRAHPERFAWLVERRAADAPYVLAQVDVGVIPPAHARPSARRTVAALIELATFDAGHSSWRVADRGQLAFADGAWVYREQLDPGETPTGDALIDLARDRTADELRNRAPAVHRLLPLATAPSDITHAFELLRWLSEARATAGAARIVLTKRIIERAAGWAVVDESAFVDGHLAIPWAQAQTINEIGRLARAAIRRLDEPAWSEAHAPSRHLMDYDAGIVHTDRVVEHLDWFAANVPAGSQERVDLERLGQRVADGAAYAAWIDELVDDFQLLRRRYSRHRNATVHGGPIDEQSVAVIVGFADALAADTLAATLDGVFARTPLRDHFAARKITFDRWKQRLTTGLPTQQLLAVDT